MSDSAKTETAFVLPVEAAGASGEPVHFGGFPGVWFPGQPIAVSELGFASVKEARAARSELAGALVEKTVKVGSAPMPQVENHVAGAPYVPPAGGAEDQHDEAGSEGDA